MFTRKQKLLLCGSVLISALLIAGSYFGRHWFYGPDVQPVPEHLLADKPRAVSMNRPDRASVFQDTPSVSEADLVSEDESFSDVGLSANSNEIDDAELEAFLEELSALEQLERDEGESSNFPKVPEGFPMTPVWLKDYFHHGDFSEHVTLYRVLIELWNQGDHDFVSGISDSGSGKVYPIYPDVIYITWDSYVRESPDGEPIEVPYLSAHEGAASTIEPLLNDDGKLFTEEEIMSGTYKTKFPGIKFVEHDSAGHDPATVLNDY